MDQDRKYHHILSTTKYSHTTWQTYFTNDLNIIPQQNHNYSLEISIEKKDKKKTYTHITLYWIISTQRFKCVCVHKSRSNNYHWNNSTNNKKMKNKETTADYNILTETRRRRYKHDWPPAPGLTAPNTGLVPGPHSGLVARGNMGLVDPGLVAGGCVPKVVRLSSGLGRGPTVLGLDGLPNPLSRLSRGLGLGPEMIGLDGGFTGTGEDRASMRPGDKLADGGLAARIPAALGGLAARSPPLGCPDIPDRDDKLVSMLPAPIRKQKQISRRNANQTSSQQKTTSVDVVKNNKARK